MVSDGAPIVAVNVVRSRSAGRHRSNCSGGDDDPILLDHNRRRLKAGRHQRQGAIRDLHHVNLPASHVHQQLRAVRLSTESTEEPLFHADSHRAIAGGRPVVWTMLYIAALRASRWCPTFKEFRARLQTAGKPVKAALIATAQKLLVALNAMIATGTDCQPPEAA